MIPSINFLDKSERKTLFLQLSLRVSDTFVHLFWAPWCRPLSTLLAAVFLIFWVTLVFQADGLESLQLTACFRSLRRVKSR